MSTGPLDVPRDVWINCIAVYLGVRDQARLSQTCKFLNNAMKSAYPLKTYRESTVSGKVYLAAKLGDKQLMGALIADNEVYTRVALCGAARGGQLDIVRKLQLPIYFEAEAAEEAIKGNHLEVLIQLLGYNGHQFISNRMRMFAKYSTDEIRDLLSNKRRKL